MFPKTCDVRTGLWRQACEEPESMTFLFTIPYGVPSCVYSLQERSCSLGRVLCFVVDVLYTRVLFTDRLYSPKTHTLKQNVTELLCFHGKQSCFSLGKQRCNDCLWGGDPLSPHFTFLCILLCASVVKYNIHVLSTL